MGRLWLEDADLKKHVAPVASILDGCHPLTPGLWLDVLPVWPCTSDAGTRCKVRSRESGALVRGTAPQAACSFGAETSQTDAVAGLGLGPGSTPELLK